ncbi:3-oxoacyl-ACP synthase [Siansivirga zeaxanthinifaciens CC-SAMT-1]|uniref:3-oxoacyl-ACP synthase n=2 Tax=Siansivirga TaxID=1204360 RepID=A0A0C5W7D4_9FLAO|nr:GreA/GreB family elongation factor [Siansivirga zeaxanthinifaciens]AJR03068.1 3-oxoacyl-ACP synthase [Siansivirga zeaxanthinifaciens CC-SAMT-1]
MTLKSMLYHKCEAFLESKLHTISKSITEIQESLTSETKSSAGDKHETGRAMLQLEREKLGNQLAEIQKTKEVLTKISVDKNAETIGLGSVVITNKVHYFLAISAGELKVDNSLFYAISASTPIGQLLLGKKAGDSFEFRGQTTHILEVY